MPALPIANWPGFGRSAQLSCGHNFAGASTKNTYFSSVIMNQETSLTGQQPVTSSFHVKLGPSASHIQPLSILLVDDDHSVRVSVADLLTNCGFHVHDATSVATAMNRIEREKIDLVITDLRLEQSSGVELIAMVREVTNIPVLLISGGSYTKIKAALQDKPQPDAILTKPLRLNDLLNAIHSFTKPTDFKLTNGH